MNRKPIRNAFLKAAPAVACLGVGLAIACAAPARAELGGTYDSVLHDQETMHATLTTEEHPAYTTYILDMADGTQVREYYSQHTGVFAVDWSGPGRLPDLNQVLGTYAERYADSVRQRHAGPAGQHVGRTTPLHRSDPDFQLESRLIMRHFKGRAFIPQSVPQEVAIEDVR